MKKELFLALSFATLMPHKAHAADKQTTAGAAVVLLALCVGTYFWWNNTTTETNPPQPYIPGIPSKDNLDSHTVDTPPHVIDQPELPNSVKAAPQEPLITIKSAPDHIPATDTPSVVHAQDNKESSFWRKVFKKILNPVDIWD